MRALLRFWWLPVLGLAVAAVASLSVVYHIGLTVPPTLTSRYHPTYTATANLLVDSASKPFFRVNLVTSEPSNTSVQVYSYRDADGKVHHVPIKVNQPGRKVKQTPNTKPLIDFANLAPQYILSDAVTTLRMRKFPQLGADPGAVTAKAIGSVVTNAKYKTSPIPMVQITASAKSERTALALAQATVQAFQDWLTQEEKGIPESERILVRQLQVPYKATASTSSSKSLAAVVFAAVLAAFVLLAGMLDRVFPRTRERRLEGRLDRIEDELDELTEPQGTAPFAFATRARPGAGDEDAAR